MNKIIKAVIHFTGFFISLFSQTKAQEFIGGGRRYLVETSLGHQNTWSACPPRIDSQAFRLVDVKWFQGIWPHFTCPHEISFLRNIHAGEIRDHRSEWKCKHCGEILKGQTPFMTTPVFMVDAETDGLMGPVWAIGAVVMNGAGQVEASFAGQLDTSVVTNEWVQAHVVPYVQDLPKYQSREELFNAFWEFWMTWKNHTTAWADCGHPVESGLFRACAEHNRTRDFQGPFPLHEVATLLWSIGINPDTNRIELSGLQGLIPHNPVDDARASAAGLLNTFVRQYWQCQ